jgi:hypothetical protein
MSELTIVAIFILALFVALFRGPGWAFALVYLPSLILFNQVPEIRIPHAPVAAQFGPLYAILIALPFGKEKLRLKWCTIDTIVVLLLISAIITAWTTEEFETGVNMFRTEILRWIGPYFLARLLFRSIKTRRLALYAMIGLIGILFVPAVIEFRLQPYFYLHVLKNAGLIAHVPEMAYSRAGFFRVSGSVEHPIYFGNMCLVMLGMIAVLARTSGVSLKNPWVLMAMLAACACIGMSISFTPYVGLAAGSAFLFMLMAIKFSRKLLLPITLLIIGTIFTYTYHTAHTPLGEKPDDELAASLYIRRLIIIESWNKSLHAGPFGWGRTLFEDNTDEDFELASVDNSYMQFTMTRGWVYTSLWISIAVFFSLRMTLAFMRVNHRSQVFPLAVSTATVLALMVSMYTVWAGALYTVVWAMMLGLANTLADMVFYPELVHGPALQGQRVRVRRSGITDAPPQAPIALARNPNW